MVKFFSACAVASALAVLCFAAPSENLPVKRFSFEEWARAISENPDGDHLSPEDAIVAYNSTIAASSLESRAADPDVTCEQDRPCYVPDAIHCINYLARKGQTACRTPKGSGVTTFCTQPQCALVGESPPTEPPSAAPCNDVAITAGRIMDSCTQGNNVQGYRIVISQPRLALLFFGPQ